MLRVRVSLGSSTVGTGLATFYFAGNSQAIADDAASAVANFWTGIAAVVVNYGTWTLEPQVDAINEASGQMIGVYNVSPASGLGSVAGDQLPTATQGLLQLRTGQVVGGREIRGRLYIPGPTETHNTASRPTAPYLTNLTTAANNLLADAGNEWGVYSRKNGQLIPISSVTGWSNWAVMRSRRD